MNLLTKENLKLQKTSNSEYLSLGLSFAPYNLANEKITICPHSSISCRESCLVFSGLNSLHKNLKSKINRTTEFLKDRKAFLKKVVIELQYYENLAKMDKLIISFRPNMYSDIDFQRYKIQENRTIFELFPDILMYDYTKDIDRISKFENYHLIYSADRYNTTDEQLIERLKNGGNVAMVFLSEIPKQWNGFEVIDGDASDLAWVGKKGVVSSLVYKNAIRKGISNKDLIKNNTLIYEPL